MSGSGPVCGIIGVGSIAAAIVNGLMRNDDGARIVLSPRNAGRSAVLASRFPGVEVAPDNQAVVDRCEVVLVCIRPHDADAVMRSLRFNVGQTVISAMAGVLLASLRELCAPAVACRAIPLPALAEGRGATPIYPSPASARALFDRIGGTVELADEAQFDAFSTATSTIAAHFVYLATIADWLTEQGVARTDADRYVADIFSSLDLAPSATEPLRDLARHHATPGGINEAFANHLVSAGLPNAVRDGLVRIFARLNDQS